MNYSHPPQARTGSAGPHEAIAGCAGGSPRSVAGCACGRHQGEGLNNSLPGVHAEVCRLQSGHIHKVSMVLIFLSCCWLGMT